jgi:hypothetical protein
VSGLQASSSAPHFITCVNAVMQRGQLQGTLSLLLQASQYFSTFDDPTATHGTGRIISPG